MDLRMSFKAVLQKETQILYVYRQFKISVLLKRLHPESVSVVLD